MAHGYNSRIDGIVVPPLSTEKIAETAEAVRTHLGLTDRHYFPVMKVYEVLDTLIDGADFQVLDPHEMGDDHGRTYPDSNLIVIRNDVYARADAGEGRDRFTMCHELGHLMLHRNLALSRVAPDRPPKLYCNSEWQADKFASFLLMPRSLVKGIALRDAPEVFGVSFDAARARSHEMKNT